MKTHPDSIFTRESDLRDLDDSGTGDLWSCRNELPDFSMTIEFVPASAYIELKTRLEKAEYSANGFESLYDATYEENRQLKSRVTTALDTIMRFGGIDGDCHKAWVIDQTVRALTGDGYDKWVDDARGETDPGGEREYDRDEGIAP